MLFVGTFLIGNLSQSQETTLWGVHWTAGSASPKNRLTSALHSLQRNHVMMVIPKCFSI
jgi:hypothetical protein